MKLILSNFFLFIFLFCTPVFGDIYFNKYIIYTSGIKIGELDWEVKIENQNFTNGIQLKSKGVLSGIYSFEGSYFSSGDFNNKKLTPHTYTHLWKTNKAVKKMHLVFKKNKLQSLKQEPIEKEQLRLNVFDVDFTKDPLSSFLQIIIGAQSSLVVDGRRFYKMNVKKDKNNSKKTIELSNYSNLWADHKRSNFEKIIFEKINGDLLPSKIFIFFDGRVFKLIKN
jgi:hypothetical protein